MRLAARLRPDPPGELERSPGPLAEFAGRAPTSNGKGTERENKGERRGWQREGKEERWRGG